MSNRHDYKDIKFGFSSAEKESASLPNLLTDGYIDISEITKRAYTGSETIFLGYKGSGKSSIAQRIDLLHKNAHDTFVNTIYLQDFNYTKFSDILPHNEDPAEKYPNGWAWVICVLILSSFSRDEGISSPYSSELFDNFRILKNEGLLFEPSMRKIIEASGQRRLMLSIPKVFQIESESAEVSDIIPNLVSQLKQLISTVQTKSKHFIFIDGLDDILTEKRQQYQAIGSLIFEVDRINIFLRKNCPNISVLLLCRTDIFELLAGANKNKIRQDSSFELNWYTNPQNLRESGLVQIANKRASLSLKENVDIFDYFFPNKIYSRDTVRYLLEMTRHTPRDFLQLLTFIQKVCSSKTPTSSEIRTGLNRYSVEYFYPEILDEMEGYSDPRKSKHFFNLVSFTGSREFRYNDIIKINKENGNKLRAGEIDILLNALFECSAIGNVAYVTGRRGRKYNQLTYRYRNRHTPFRKEQTIILHRGLWRALNLPESGEINKLHFKPYKDPF